MKKVLIITSHFAPDAHVGAKRPTKFAKFLPEHGWQPVILTQPLASYHRLDLTLSDNLSHNLTVFRVGQCRGLRFMDYRLFLYSFSWLAPAFWASIRLLKQKKISLVFTTAPSYEPHLLGLLLKILTGKKWVCEYRDPWVLSPDYLPPFRLIRAIDLWLTRGILKNADHLITVSRTLRERFVGLDDGCRHKFSVIYNGYDADDFANPNDHKPSEKMTITYLGTWGQSRTPEPFLRALGRLLRKREELREKISVEFIGEVKWDPQMDARLPRIIEEESLEDVVHIRPFMSHREGLVRLYESEVLLLLQSRVHAEIGALGAKLAEYLYAGKPILALVSPGSEIAGLIERAKAGVIVSPEDVQEIEDAIYKMWELFQSGKLTSAVDPCVVAEFDRRKQTGVLAEIFNNLCPSRSLQ